MNSSHNQHSDLHNQSSRVHSQNSWIPVENVLLSNQNTARLIHQSHLHDQQQVMEATMREKLNYHLKKRSASPVLSLVCEKDTPIGSTKSLNKYKKAKRSDSDTECREEKHERSHDRHHKPDILSTILNQKKASLMQDPEVLAFFRKFVKNQAR